MQANYKKIKVSKCRLISPAKVINNKKIPGMLTRFLIPRISRHIRNFKASLEFLCGELTFFKYAWRAR